MAIPESNPQKILLREQMRETLRDTAAPHGAIHCKLDRWLADHPQMLTIATFAALPGEVDLSRWVAAHSSRSWAYPKVAQGHHLTFHLVADPAVDLSPGAFGIMEPCPSLPEVSIDGIDAFLCPGIAFDLNGGRLGRGRGFYDRILAKARPDALKIGVCFPNQIVVSTFSEAHDARMDEVFF